MNRLNEIVAIAALVLPREIEMSSTSHVALETVKEASVTAKVEPMAGRLATVKLPAFVAVLVGIKSHFIEYS